MRFFSEHNDFINIPAVRKILQTIKSSSAMLCTSLSVITGHFNSGVTTFCHTLTFGV